MGILPNLQLAMHDLAHGARRITSRPWAADPVLQEVYESTLTFVSSIERSGELKTWFNSAKTMCGVKSGIQGFSFAKHRFNSTSTPLARAVRHFHPLIKTAELVIDLRRNQKCAHRAKDLLQKIASHGDSFLILLGMLADAGSENLSLLRFVDKEDVNTAYLRSHVADFKSRIVMLFVDGGCLASKSCHTGIACEVLKSPLVFKLNGRPQQIGRSGGAPGATQQACLKRISAWVKTAGAVLEAEFPRFVLWNAFEISALALRTMHSLIALCRMTSTSRGLHNSSASIPPA